MSFYSTKRGNSMNIKEEIIKTYIQLVMNNMTTDITVKEICDIAKISRTSFYKYFKDSYNIIEYIFTQDAMYSLEPLINNDLSVQTIMENWYLSFYRHKDFYLVAIKENGQNSLFDTVLNIVEEYNRKIFTPYASGVDFEYISYKYSSLQAMLLKKWMLDGMKIQPSKLAQYFAKDFIKEHFQRK